MRPTLEFRRGDDLVVHALASPDVAWFQGHFPGAPLLPGVAMLALVEESLALFWHGHGRAPARVESFRRIRFRQRVEPQANLRVRVHQIEPSRFRFSVEVGGAAACTGECRATEAGLPSTEQRGPVSPPAFLRGEMANTRFCSDGTTLGEVAARATRLRALVATGASVCVASDDRVDVAAALVAALCGDIKAVFPPALAPEALAETYRARPFAHWLGPATWLTDLPELAPLRIEMTSEAPGEAVQALALAPADETRVVLHTGGTTSQPCPWRKTVRNLLDEITVHAHGLQVGPTDHIVATVPPHHIYGLLFSVLLPLHSGASVERHSPFYPEEIAERIAGTSATMLVSTPAHLRALATSLTTRHRLRLVLSSGAPLSASDAATFAASTGLWPLEVYGSTETGGIAVRRQDQPESPWAPLPGVDCRVDGDLLAVRSAYVSSDAGVAPDGFFATADLASLRADGTFDLLGRSDGIVKVGGQRVALPDIERALASLDHVAGAVVVALPAQSGRGQEIFALVVSPRKAEDLVHELRTRLPSPAWPRRVRCVDVIPTTPSGKRDRAAILRLLDARDGAGDEN